MTDNKQKEMLLAKKALELKITNTTTISSCLKLQQQMQQNGQGVSLVDCLLHNKKINNQQLKIIQDAILWQEKNKPGQITFLHYHILQELGSGGMGIVYKVYDTRSGRVAALKILKNSESTKEMDRFLLEARTLAQLNHPHIINVYEVGDYKNLYYTMEYITGHDLSHYTRPQNHLLPDNVAKIFSDVASALDKIHNQGIVHRDIKPANIILNEKHSPKLMDFGLIKKQKIDHQFSSTGQIIGTPYYMPPEQIDGGKVTHRTDIYSLGITMYEILTGILPFYSPQYSTLVQRITHEEPTPPRNINPQIPIELEAICLKCLHKNPYKRYPSAHHLQQDLQKFLQNETVSAKHYTSIVAAKKFIHRNKWLMLSISIIFSTIILATVTYVSMYKKYAAKIYTQKQNSLQALKEAFSALYTVYNYHNALKENTQLIQGLHKTFEEIERLEIVDNLENHQEMLMLYGLVCSQSDDLQQKGIQIYSKIIRQKPNFAKAYTNRGHIYHLLKKNQLALLDFNKAINLENDNKAYTNRGYLYLEQGKYIKAEQDFNKAIFLNPDNAEAYGNKAILYRRQKKYKKALELYKKAIEISPMSENFYSNRGLLYQEISQFDLAMKDYERAIRYNPKYYGVYCNRGKLYSHLNKSELAKKDFLHALELNPNFYQVHNNLAMLYIRNNNYKKAHLHIKKAIEIFPRYSNAYANLGNLYKKQSKNKQAIIAWKKAILLKSPHQKVLETYISELENK
ncbi:protein kinase [Candidatus Uabimicrobium sp. HlEnr_7]|uniref:protein kinase domain-containing protein n=1 Tax=Candidatus Uabimicrobium helgolandensis TaxID=3095367 RepID=UPI0035583408